MPNDGDGDGDDGAGTRSDIGASDGGADGSASLEPIRVFRGDPSANYFDLTLEGQDLAAFEGVIVTVRVGEPFKTVTQRLGSGQTQVVGGTFSMHLPAVLEGGYKSKIVHFDVDRDGLCGAGDSVWVDEFLINMSVTLLVRPDARLTSPPLATTCRIVNEWPSQ